MFVAKESGLQKDSAPERLSGAEKPRCGLRYSQGLKSEPASTSFMDPIKSYSAQMEPKGHNGLVPLTKCEQLKMS